MCSTTIVKYHRKWPLIQKILPLVVSGLILLPPHNPTSIKRRISSVEGSSFDNADLFADILCATPLKEGHISILRTDGPGLSPNEPMAVVVPVTIPIPDGKYVIHNKAADIYWIAGHNPIQTVYFWLNTLVEVKKHNFAHVSEHSYSSVQRINFFRSGTSHMIPMVTSS